MPLLMLLPRISIKTPKISFEITCVAVAVATPSVFGLVGTVLSSQVGASPALPPAPPLPPGLPPAPPLAPLAPAIPPVPPAPLMPPIPPMPHPAMVVLLQATLQFSALPVS